MSNKDVYEQALLLVQLLPKLNRCISHIDTDDPAIELPLAQIRICAILQDEPRTMSALSKDLDISLSAITQMADRLEKSELVERVPEADDRRVKCLQLTEHGAQMMEKRKIKRIERAADLLSKLAPEEREVVLSSIENLLDAGLASDSNTNEKIPVIDPVLR